ncbi:MAG: hypothetical protein V1676_01315 [Candidatus Diapherotrites archaeon]
MPKQMGEAGIIDIIQKMVEEGESEEKIVQTLKDLGVEPDKAKRLLLLGQADTFALLRGEISKIVAADLEKQKPALEDYISKTVEKSVAGSKEKVEAAVMADLKKYEKDITGQSKTFQEMINENVRRVAELSDRVREQLNNLGEAVQKVQVDMDEIKVKGVGGRNRLVALALLFAGFVFLAADFYLFFGSFGGAVTIDSIIITVVMALVGITLLFVATVI